ncbi:hypothetical protein DFJ74DRAFT_430841 [Hyaloraphidium curvatum]|nr:hypothetical protein DFJ74DRAFT_430841 [Hyaloraphidium curvatum]
MEKANSANAGREVSAQRRTCRMAAVTCSPRKPNVAPGHRIAGATILKYTSTCAPLRPGCERRGTVSSSRGTLDSRAHLGAHRAGKEPLRRRGHRQNRHVCLGLGGRSGGSGIDCRRGSGIRARMACRCSARKVATITEAPSGCRSRFRGSDAATVPMVPEIARVQCPQGPQRVAERAVEPRPPAPSRTSLAAACAVLESDKLAACEMGLLRPGRNGRRPVAFAADRHADRAPCQWRGPLMLLGRMSRAASPRITRFGGETRLPGPGTRVRRLLSERGASRLAARSSGAHQARWCPYIRRHARWDYQRETV